MRGWWAMAGAIMVAGCGGDGGKSPEPLPTSSPDQAVFYVPAMT